MIIKTILEDLLIFKFDDIDKAEFTLILNFFNNNII